MPEPEQLEARCRAIEEADLPYVVDCLTRNFPGRDIDYWRRGLVTMTQRSIPPGAQRYGFLLYSGGKVVGSLLQIVSARLDDDGSHLRANLSSWCVDPAHRGFAIVLHRQSVAQKDVTYVNISAAAHTREAIEALGFRRYANGQMFFAPLASKGASGARVVAYSERAPEARMLSEAQRRLLIDHTELGCLALIGVNNNVAYPFVLQERTVWRRVVPGAHVIYAPSHRELVSFSRALGLYCARRGRLFLVVDANEPIEGLTGKFFEGREPRYFKGPDTPSPCDLTYTELTIFGR